MILRWYIGVILCMFLVCTGCNQLSSVGRSYFAMVAGDSLKVYVSADLVDSKPDPELLLSLTRNNSFIEYCRVLVLRRLDEERIESINSLSGKGQDTSVCRLNKKYVWYSWSSNWDCGGKSRRDFACRRTRSYGLERKKDGTIILSVKDWRSDFDAFKIKLPAYQPEVSRKKEDEKQE